MSDHLDEYFEVEVNIRGPEYDGQYHPQRDLLAKLDLKARPDEAFAVFSQALERLTCRSVTAVGPNEEIRA